MAEKWTGPAKIAWCPEHGLHGARDTCFECGKQVEQVEMVPLEGAAIFVLILGAYDEETTEGVYWELETAQRRAEQEYSDWIVVWHHSAPDSWWWDGQGTFDAASITRYAIQGRSKSE